ncbi:MarR family winged helix-turn-helix transcriptional regulator [Paenibacillus sp. XY044]|uniref:MarR family winged helix-turn-helix transcriptional regulator n=1 Tax=Paenibacillus sp. XY044 TaxID=2026089 RepID=UPI000B995A7F|nr:MarR family transcriptional regulator [Paenibacillus sp. XY044]OZB98301.1 MarR family transcriptional regulator [Paenibacillus sp. XY044]
MTQDEELSNLFNRVSERHAIIKNMEEKRLFRFMRENSFLEVHCIDLIDHLEDPNVTKLSKALRVTRGAVSKTTKKLIQDGLIEKYQKPGNKKEIYYRMTEAGMELLREHEEMHRARVERDRTYFSPLTGEEKQQMIDMLKRMYGEISEDLKKMGLDNII